MWHSCQDGLFRLQKTRVRIQPAAILFRKGENKEKEAGLALLRTNIIKEAVVVAQWSLLTPEDPGLKPAMSNFQDYMYF